MDSHFHSLKDEDREIKRKEEDRDGYISDDPVMFASDIEDLDKEISQLKSSKDQSGSKLLETKKTYKDNLTTLKSIGAGKSSTGMLNRSGNIISFTEGSDFQFL